MPNKEKMTEACGGVKKPIEAPPKPPKGKAKPPAKKTGKK